MAIGRVQTGINPEMNGADRVLYLEDYSSTSGSIFSPSDTNELIWDVVLTDNYFVTSGTIGLSTQVLTMRRVPIGTPQATFPTFFSGYQYVCTNPFKSGVRAANLKNDSIVMAAYIDSASIVGSDIKNILTCWFTIDVPSADMKYRQQYYTRISYNSSRMLPPRDMAYLSNSEALMVIDTISITRNKSFILQLSPYLTTTVLTPWLILYVPPFYYNKGCRIEYNSVVANSPSECMVAAGANWLKIDLQGGSLPPLHHTNDCISIRNLDIFKCDVFPALALYDGTCILYDRTMRFETNPIGLTQIYSCTAAPPHPIDNKFINELSK